MNATPEHPEAAPEADLCGARRYGRQHPGPGRHRLPCLLPGGHDGDHRDAFNATWSPARGDCGDCGTAASSLETLTVPEPDGTFPDGPACGPSAGRTAAPGRPERGERRPVPASTCTPAQSVPRTSRPCRTYSPSCPTHAVGRGSSDHTSHGDRGAARRGARVRRPCGVRGHRVGGAVMKAGTPPEPGTSRLTISAYRLDSNGRRVGVTVPTAYTPGPATLASVSLGWPPCRCPRCRTGHGPLGR
ncbi:hypothetical protein GCM10017771_33010 [Streptomyces capitiformicae]|uniref:Uncharacterized protein n=1 Tax=Streptomyces capitiformicae TaxID=2014920 RepID=A0A919GQP3_9ACTN|nr:hypothetical protein GCM10017771_33010 [Streptomyces capitiformicae]